MERFAAIVEYDGMPFQGWQRQPHKDTIQDKIEAAFHGFYGQPLFVHAAGRTDSGVHAKGQVIHFDLEGGPLPFKIRDAVNYHLKPLPIALVEVFPVDPTFHARFSAIKRFYTYRLCNRYAPTALQRNRVWRIPQPLDLDAMRAAAELLLGTHDFSTFRGSHCQATSPIRTLESLDIEKEGDEIRFHLSSRSFLHHQVRNIVGTLVLVGLGKWQVLDFKDALNAKDRRRGGPTAPAQGLYFTKVIYPDMDSKCTQDQKL